MNKILKTPIRNFSFHNIPKCQGRFKISNGVKILIISIAVFSVCLISAKSVQAQPADFVVEFQNDPLFSQANFLPGDNVIRWIKITNNSAGIFKIATATDVNTLDNSDGLGDVLNLEIKKGGVSFYNDTLSNFFNAGEVFLSDLASNETQTQYDYIISFDSGVGNTYQGKSLSFDILIGYQSSAPVGGTYAFVGGGYSTTTTIPPTTTTTIPGEVAGESIKREFFQEGGEEGTTTTTTTPPSKFVAGASIIRSFSCPVNLTMLGINPLLASLLCLGQNACDACSNPLIILLLGIGILIIVLFLAATKRFNNWIAFIIALAVIVYLLLFVLGVCLSPWLIFIIGLLVIGGAVYLVYQQRKK